jgi:sigma-B regulation protein RsbU (phosphoserine phosphatase)
MSKPFIPDILLSKVKVFVELYNQRKKLQGLVEELNHANSTLTRYARQLEMINKIGRQITSILELKELLPQIFEIIQSQFNYTFVSIWLVNDSRDALVLEASTSFDGLNDASNAVAIPIKHDGLVAKSCRSGEMVLENKASTNLYYVPTPGMSRVGAEIALPLVIQKETLGVLGIQSERPHAFTAEDVAALETLALQIVIAIRNARMYSKVK